jgi:hypothetical protein
VSAEVTRENNQSDSVPKVLGKKATKLAPLFSLRITPSHVNLLLAGEVVEEESALLRLLTPVLDNDARAVDDLAGVALTVKNAYTELSLVFTIFEC